MTNSPGSLVAALSGSAGRHALAVLLVMLFAWMVSNLDQSLFGYAVPGIVAEFKVGLETIGGILSLSFAVAAVFAVVSGVAADRYGRRYTLAFLLAASALFVGLHGYATSITSLTLLRTLAFGLAAGIAPITAAYVAEAAPARHRGLLMGILQCGYPLGWFAASILAAPLLDTHGWRSIFLIGFAMIPVALLIGWRLPESRRFEEVRKVQFAASGGDSGSHGHPLRDLFSGPYRARSIACILLFFTFGCAYAGTAFYFPTFFMSERGYSQSEAATLVGVSNGIAVIGYLAAAAVGEYFWTRRNTYALWCVLGALALLALMWVPRERWQDLLWFSLTAAFFYGSNAVVGTLLADLFPTRMRATAYAVCGSAPLSLGFATYPSVVPLVVAKFGWPMALSLAIVPLLVLSALAALWLPNLRSGQEIADV